MRLAVVNIVIWSLVAAAAAIALRDAPWSAAGGPVPAAVAAPPAADAPGPTRFRWPPAERFAALVERPLFTPERRAPAPPSEEPPAADVVAPALTLTGVLAADGARIALVRTEAGVALRLRLGDDVTGWTARRIDDRTLTLGLGARVATYRLGERSGGASVASVRDTPEPAATTPRAAARSAWAATAGFDDQYDETEDE